MNIAAYFIRNRVISWMLTILILIGGALSYQSLSRLEDPEFTVKDATITTAYPGASPQQVEEEVTYLLENAIQQLSYVDYVTSVSSTGLSQINVTMKRQYGKEDLPQIWDELRRKVNDVSRSLPPGVQTPLVNDDVGDIYGLLLSVVGDGYTIKELNDYADYLRRELVLVNGVGKVRVDGKLKEQVFIEISLSKLAQFGIPLSRIYDLLTSQNVVSNAGAIHLGSEYVRFNPTGEFTDVRQLGNLAISDSGASELVYLRDVADVTRGFEEVPSFLNSLNGRRAITLGVSFASGANVVDVGKAVQSRLTALEYARPVGIEVSVIYDQPSLVEASVDNFVLNLLAAVVIVVAVLLVFMGMRSGLLIGLILFLTVVGSFIFFKLMNIELQRISLGALIIALGMLVDNAIVVTEGILIGVQRGLSKLEAAVAIVRQTIWPLLGATVIAIIAFAPIGLSQDSTGEMLGSLFWVLLISLLLSWFTAISLTPFFADLLLQGANTQNPASDDPYGSKLFVMYKRALDTCMKKPAMTLIALAGLLVVSVVVFKQVKVVFFPAMTTPMFTMDYWRSQGTDIRDTFADIQALENWLTTQDEVVQVSSNTGRGGIRFMLTYPIEKSYPSFGQLLVEVQDYRQIDPLARRLAQRVATDFPDSQIKFRKFELGPQKPGKIEARFSGPDPDVLRQLAVQAEAIFRAEPGIAAVRNDWRERSKMIRPQFAEAQARRAGISKQDIDDTLLMAFSGKQVGLYREGTTLLPIIARPPATERTDIDNLPNLQIWSPASRAYIPIEQVTSGFTTEWEDSIIMRRDRKRTLTVLADPDVIDGEPTSVVFKRIREPIEAIALPQGYAFEWGGEFEASEEANTGIYSSLPIGLALMFVITVLLFGTLRQAVVIWLTVPLALIGVAWGLFLMGRPFTFMALLGFISLVGMLIKNGIVLVDQIRLELAEGKEPYQAVFDSAVSRVRPVAMAAITTILGMLPLLMDVFFEAMAVTIMFGLGFATILTLIAVPVAYILFYRIPYQPLKN
ncbi:MAG: efflux RND transporter permease subunit [Gammaproteobacteria bacterium]|nr:MAG: efflux RND transporter permease subunit [Gammaproteobacteria bacterium]